MAKVEMLLLLLVNLSTSVLLLDISQIKVFPKQGSISGVFHASASSYAFNSSTAREVCEQLGVTIADKSQVLQAFKRGFETCRFGWIDEQIAVIPRIQANPACGKGNVGVIPWRTALHAKFDVFCFNSTDYEEQMRKTTSAPSTLHTSSSTGGVLLTDLLSTSSSSSSSLNYIEDMEEAQALGSTNPSIGVVPTALLITTIFTFLLAAVVAVWYFKMSRSCTGLWEVEQQKECIETEVWNKCEKNVETHVEEKHNQEKTSDISVKMDCENESKSRAAS